MRDHVVVLREVAGSDLPTFFQQQLDEDANRLAAFPSRNEQAFRDHWARILMDHTVIKRTILFDGKVPGNLVSFEHSGKRELGYWLGKNYWGRGIATAALSPFLMAVVFRPLYAHVAKHNLASIRVLEKCGFEKVGEDKQFSSMGSQGIEGFIFRLD